MTVPADAIPDLSTIRIQVLLAAGDERAGLQHELPGIVRTATTDVDPTIRVCVLTEVSDDPFPANNPDSFPMDAVVDLQGPAGMLTVDGLRPALEATVAALGGRVDPARSGVVVGWPQAVIPGARGELRYLYLMRRRPQLSRDDYLDHYFHRHSAFAFHLGGINAYTQIHADPAASAELAARLGFGVHDIDSVTELTFDTIEGFFAGVTAEAAGAGEDELAFVDRQRSVSFCSLDHTVRPEIGL